MFLLYFFTGDDPSFSEVICNMSCTHNSRSLRDDFVKEGEFDTLPEALNRLDHIGSRWFFFPNACIIEDDFATKGGREIVGVYMEDGINFIARKFASMH